MTLSQRTARARVPANKFKSFEEYGRFCDTMDSHQDSEDFTGIPQLYKDILLECEAEVKINQIAKCLTELKSYLSQINIDTSANNYKLLLRRNGKHYSFSEHLEGLILSLLSSQRDWAVIENNREKINNIFGNYDKEYLKTVPSEYLITSLTDIKCGNRNIKKQMSQLNKNILILEKIELEYGSLDAFVVSEPAYNIAKKLSNKKSIFKLYCVGNALAWEYLRNVGIDGIKPDVHVKRFLGRNRVGFSKKECATEDEVYRQACKLSELTGLTLTEIDSIIWNYCAKSSANLCEAHPKCDSCSISKFCNYPCKDIIHKLNR